jgi:hypothetical protein
MFGSHKVKIEGELLEKETKKILPDESSTSKEEIQKRLRGLGYIE